MQAVATPAPCIWSVQPLTTAIIARVLGTSSGRKPAFCLQSPSHWLQNLQYCSSCDHHWQGSGCAGACGLPPPVSGKLKPAKEDPAGTTNIAEKTPTDAHTGKHPSGGNGMRQPLFLRNLLFQGTNSSTPFWRHSEAASEPGTAGGRTNCTGKAARVVWGHKQLPIYEHQPFRCAKWAQQMQQASPEWE